MSSLQDKALSGVAWSAFDRWSQAGLRFLIQIVLARLLLPEQFGLLAMVLVFVGIAINLTDVGFSSAIVQKKDLKNEDLSTAFCINAVLGIVFTGVLWVSAPWIAAFYREAELVPILQFVCIAVLVRGLSRVHLAYLTKQMQFKRTALATFPATLVGGVVAIVMALHGFGVYALVAQFLIQAFVESALLGLLSGWRTELRFSMASARVMFPYSSKMALSGFVSQIFNNLYVLVIGRTFPAAELAYYQRAVAFKNLSGENLNAVIARVAFPTFASIQTDLERLKRAFLKAVALVSLISFAVAGLLGGFAEPIIVLLIGERWLPTVPYLQILALTGGLYPLHALNLNVLTALGHAGKHLQLEIIKRTLSVIVLIITFRYGLVAIVWGQVFCSLVAFFINSHYTRKFIQVSLPEQGKAAAKGILIAALLYATGFALHTLLDVHAFWILVFGGILAAAFGAVLWMCGQLEEVRTLQQRYLRKK